MIKFIAFKNMESAWLLFLIWLFCAISTGCQAINYESHWIKSQTAADQAQIRMSPGELRTRLDDLAAVYSGSIEQAADRVIAETSDPEIERHALLWKLNSIPAAYRALFQADPAVALIDTWAFSSQMADYFENGPGKDDFEQFSHIALDASRKLEATITQLVAQTRTDENIEPFRDKVRVWVAEHPIQRDFVYRDTAVQVLTTNLDKKKLDALQTVGNLALSVEDIAFRLFAYMDMLTKQARWQSELLMGDPYNDAGFGLALNSLNEMVATVDRIAPILEKAPEMLVGEKEKVLAALRQERNETLVDIDRQRIDTLNYLTRERMEAVENLNALQYDLVKNLRTEKEAVLELIIEQRKALLIETENAGNRMIQNSMRQSKDVIDHLFVRIAQFSAAIILLGGLIFAAVKLGLKRKKQHLNDQQI